MIGSPSLGAPGVYRAADQPLRRLTGVRMDVCAFVGVAPRGPAREPPTDSPWPDASPFAGRGERRSVPVPVESWTEYVRLFGGSSGPGLLPYAVHSFFRQGGRRAWVVRVVHDYGDVRDREGRATAPLAGLLPTGDRGLPLRAAAPGSGGNGIRARASWDTEDLGLKGLLAGGFALAPGVDVVAGDLLRVERTDGSRRFQRVESVRDDELATSPVRVAVPAEPPRGNPVAVERVRLDLSVDGDGPSETHAGLGVVPEHPRWIGRVLTEEGSSVRPDPRWSERELRPAWPSLPSPSEGEPFRGGAAGRPARGTVPGLRVLGDGVWLEARSEGRWGDRLRASLSFRLDPVETVASPAGDDELSTMPDAELSEGETILFGYEDGSREVRTVVDAVDGWLPDAPKRVRRLILNAAPSGDPDDLTRVARVEADLRVREVPGRDGAEMERSERFDGLGLSPDHPRWLHGVLRRESELIRPHEDWRSSDLEITPGLLEGDGPESGPFRGGRDRYGDIEHADFFDDRWSAAGERPGSGIQSVGDLEEVALLVVPDLYAPAPLPPEDDVTGPVSLAGPEFAPCVHPATPTEQAKPSLALDGLRLDADDPTERARIVELQRAVADFARKLRRFVVLLDVPPGLGPDEVLRWRRRFGSDFAAAYHPWTEVVLSEDGRSEPVRMNPSAVAAGIVARVERDRGVHHGPANVLARGVVRLEEEVPPRRHDVLHPRGINVFRQEPSGIHLTGARTLSRDPAYRQLSVRRLVSMLVRTLEREMAWTAFEPNNRALRRQVTRLLTGLLRRLHRANALAGTTEEEAFFVRCDETLNPPRAVDAGRLLAEVGVAPAEPAEYLVLRIVRDPDGSVRAET